jgi:feruloyl esterase
VTQANRRPDGTEILSRDKVAAVAAAVTRACDARDGLADGLIDDSRRCDWKPAALACPAKIGSEPILKNGSEPISGCLQPDEVAVLEKWYGGPHDSRGKQLYPGGVPRGSEPYWPLWLTGAPGTENPALVTLFARDFLRFMAFAADPGESHHPGQFDFDLPQSRALTDDRPYHS